MVKSSFVRTIKPLLILTGWWPANLSKKPCLRVLYSWSLTIYLGIYSIMWILATIHLICLIRADIKSGARAESLAVAVTAFTTFAKVIVLEIRDFSILIAEIIKQEDLISRTRDKIVRFYYTQQVKNYKMVIKGITYISLGVTISMMGVGIYKYFYGTDLVTSSDKETIEDPLLLPIWLPFKESEHIVFVFLINFPLLTVGNIVYLTFYMSLATCMIFSATLLQIVQVKIKNLDLVIYESERNISPYKYLVEIAREHLYAIEFVNRLNGFIQYVVFVDFVFNSLSLASVIVQILTVETLKDFFFPLAYTLDVTMQIFAMGYLSNEIKVQSLAVADALYQTNWYNQDVRFRRVLLLMMVRAQRPLTISIGPFGAMTNEKVFGTMKAAYSYITIMYNNK